MKFLAFYSVVLFYFLRFAEAAPDPDSTISTSALNLNPIISILPCAIIEIFIVEVVALCIYTNYGIDLFVLLACTTSILPLSLGNLFSSILNSLANGAQVLAATCSTPITYWSGVVTTLCPGILPTINAVLYEYSDQESTNVRCGSQSISLPGCVIIEIFIVFYRLLCGLDAVGLGLKVPAITLANLLPSPFDDILVGIINGVALGFGTGGAVCDEVLDIWSDGLDSMDCPNFLQNINQFLQLVFPSPS